MKQAWSDDGGPRDRAYRAYRRRCQRTGEVYREPGNVGVVASGIHWNLPGWSWTRNPYATNVDPPVVIVSNRYHVLARYEILPSGRLREVT